MLDVDAYILIGGRSIRFGADKAFVEFDGEMLASRAARFTETALDPARIAFVAADAEQFENDKLVQLGHAVIFDARPGFGAWSALHAALADGESEWIFVLACDLPFITTEFLKVLSDFANSDADAVIPRQADRRLQPLCAFYRRTATLPAMERYLTGQGQLPPLNTIAGDLRARLVEPDELSGLDNSAKFLVNVNSPVGFLGTDLRESG